MATATKSNASNKAGGMSQLQPDGSKTGDGGGGAEPSERSQVVVDSVYGNVKPPNQSNGSGSSGGSSNNGPRITPGLEALRDKIDRSLLNGSIQIALVIAISAVFFFFGVAAMRGNLLFLDPPDLKKLATPIHTGQ